MHVILWVSLENQPKIGTLGNIDGPKWVGFHMVLGVTPPFFPGILLSRKPPKTLGKRRSVFEKNDG